MVKVEQYISMNGGDGDVSYAINSSYQRGVMSYAKNQVEDTLAEAYKAISSNCIAIADLGCGSGPNSGLFVLQVMEIIERTCNEMRRDFPNVQVYLSDLPSNDFNNISKSFPVLYRKLEKRSKKCFVAVLPGSFYGRLFPCNSLHFVHSSFALHWLSEAPRGLINENGEPLNKGNICIAETSSHLVHKLYNEQFEKDFHLFLKLRSEEMVIEGGMVLTLMGSVHGDHSFRTVEVIGLALFDMANEGLIEESKLDMFNMPLYTPSAKEIRRVVRKEGSFSITKLKCFDMAWDAQMHKETPINQTSTKNGRGKYVAKLIRATTEPLLANIFGDIIMDELFRRVEHKCDERMNVMECKGHNIILSLRKLK